MLIKQQMNRTKMELHFRGISDCMINCALLNMIIIGRQIINNENNKNDPDFGVSEYASPLISFWYTFFFRIQNL